MHVPSPSRKDSRMPSLPSSSSQIAKEAALLQQVTTLIALAYLISLKLLPGPDLLHLAVFATGPVPATTPKRSIRSRMSDEETTVLGISVARIRVERKDTPCSRSP
jgi:hypothetical protein